MNNAPQAPAPSHPSGRAARKFTALCMLTLGVMLAACGGDNGPPPLQGAGPDGLVRVAANPTDQWSLASAADVGMDGALITGAVARLSASHRISSMLVLRQGKPVFEQYWNGYDKDTLHDLRSATKSITSLLVGIAIDKKMIASVDDTLASHLGMLYPGAPAYQQGVTLAHMLTMRSGLDCDDWNGGSPGNEENMYKQGDWIKFYTSLAAVRQPGSATRYCTGNPVALGRVVALATKTPIPRFADYQLFAALNIQAVRWAQYDGGAQTDTGGHLYMRPRDMAKLGQLALQKGAWNGRQLISAAWIEESMRHHTQFDNVPSHDGYGYLWWRAKAAVKCRPVDLIYANGNGGQLIVVVPELEVVAVFTGENYNADGIGLPFAILANVLAAVN